MVDQRAIEIVKGQDLLGPVSDYLSVIHELLALDPGRRLLQARYHLKLPVEQVCLGIKNQ